MAAAAVRAGTHQPALDGIRGLAVLLVVAAHTRITPLDGGGYTGLVLFFALSGYLITSNLLRERRTSGTVALGRFYARRARRLFPALLVMVAVVTVAGWVAVGDAVWSVTYLGNWIRALGVTDLGLLGHTWSLAVEEQFYLAMPLLVAAVPVTRLRPFLVAAAVGVMLWRPVLWLATGDETRLEFGFDTRSDAILLGCLLAMTAWRPGRRTVYVAAVTLAGLSVWPAVPFTFGLTAAAVAAVVLVAHGSVLNGPLLASNVMRWLGTRSYGIYLWHAPLLWRADELGIRTAPVTVALVAVACVLAEGSYRLVETRFRSGPDHLHIQQPVGGVDRRALSTSR